MTLDESIKILRSRIQGGYTNNPHTDLEDALHAFAAAIQRERTPEPCYHENHRYGKPCPDCNEKPPEPKPKCSCGESTIVHRTDGPCYHIEKRPTPELPEDVKIQISRLVWLEATMDDKIFMRAELEKFAHLCLSMRAK